MLYTSRLRASGPSSASSSTAQAITSRPISPRTSRFPQPPSKPARTSPKPTLPPASDNISNRSLLGSYKALSPNTRILFGAAIAVVGFAGLYFDAQVLPTKEEVKPLVGIRVVDRE